MSNPSEREPFPFKYQFVYLGQAPEVLDENPERGTASSSSTIKLYKRYRGGFWQVGIDFPFPQQPLAQKKFCADYFNLMGLIEESNALERRERGERRPEDDLLLLGRMLLDAAGQGDVDICPGERSLKLKPWGYLTSVGMNSLRPVPYYDCQECGASDLAGNYNKMTTEAIVYISGKVTEYRKKSIEHRVRGIVLEEDIDGIFAGD